MVVCGFWHPKTGQLEGDAWVKPTAAAWTLRFSVISRLEVSVLDVGLWGEEFGDSGAMRVPGSANDPSAVAKMSAAQH